MSSFIPSLEMPETTQLVTRGVCRLFQNLGFGTQTEFKLSNGRRVDVMAIDRNGDFVIVEVKSSIADYRSDRKWHEYLIFSERFYFAVPAGFPVEMIPDDLRAHRRKSLLCCCTPRKQGQETERQPQTAPAYPFCPSR